MNMKTPALIRLAAVFAAMTALAGCSSVEKGLGWAGHQVISAENATVGAARKSLFAGDEPEAIRTSVQSKSLFMRAAADGSGFADASIEEANRFLLSQGPIRRQVLTVVPLTEKGRQLAKRLAAALEEAGANEPRLGRYVTEDKSGNRHDFPDRRTGWDIELISEAYVVQAPDCRVADERRWAIEPYYAMGVLGCANRVNIAMMTSDPRDLLRPRALAPADGEMVTNVYKKYQKGEAEELPEIDFSQDE